MRCTLSPTAFAAALTLVSRAVSPRSTLPVLGNVLLETSDKGLRVTGTNLDLTIAATVPATIAEEGRTTVPSRLLTEYIGSLGDAPCTLELDPANQVTRISCGPQRTNLHGIDPVEFPPLPVREGEGATQLRSEELQKAIAQTAMAASGDEASPVLTGLLLLVDGPRLTMVATDRHRLAVKKLELESPAGTGDGGPVIVPARHMNEVARAITAARPSVFMSVSHGRNQAFFTVGDVEISTRLIEGTYPNYAQVIPNETTTTVTAATQDLLRLARTASVLARDAGNPVRLAVGDNELTLLAQTAEVGDHQAPLEARVIGDGLQIAFNARYLIEALSVIDGDDVELSFTGPLQPGIIRAAGHDDYLCVIMPVRVP
ncbi:MAG: DNA polymerase III subunit beta [Candidatus Dormibacteria bacterium]